MTKFFEVEAFDWLCLNLCRSHMKDGYNSHESIKQPEAKVDKSVGWS